MAIDYSELIKRCQENESESRVRGTAMSVFMTTRVIGKFKKGSIKLFQDLAWCFSARLRDIKTMDEFDAFHHDFVTDFSEKIRLRDGSEPAYGEAQKPINVFLKVYVDRSSLPNPEAAMRLRPFLHVPLDSKVIKHFQKRAYREDYERFLTPAHRNKFKPLLDLYKESHPGNEPPIPKEWVSPLEKIDEQIYSAWQTWFRHIYPEKPVLLDTIWSLERKR